MSRYNRNITIKYSKYIRLNLFRNAKSIIPLLFFILAITGAYSVCKGDCIYSLTGDLNQDCKVNLYDLVIMANNWLVDCNSNPQNPACNCNWKAEPPMFTGRDQFTGGVINGKIYVFGGNGNPDQVNLASTEVYDPATSQWTQLADNNHNNNGDGVEELTSAVVNGKLYVFGAYGGIGPSGNYGDINFNEMYNPATNTWTTLAHKPTLVSGAPATVYNGEIYLFGGGYSYDGMIPDSIHYRVVEAYNPTSNTWRFVTNMPSDREALAVATIGNKAYLFGGVDPNTLQFFDDVITYNFQTGVWDTNGFEPMPVKRASGYSSAAPVINGKVFLISDVVGVIGNVNKLILTNRVDIYDTTTNTWHTGTPLPLPLTDQLSLALGSKIYVLGGDNEEVDGTFQNRSKAEVISISTDPTLCGQ